MSSKGSKGSPQPAARERSAHELKGLKGLMSGSPPHESGALMSSKGSKVKGLKGLMSGRLQRSCVSCDSAPGLGRRGAGRPGGRPRGGGGREGVYSRDTGRGNSREGGAWTASQRGRWKRVSRHTTRSNAPARPPARHAPAPADVQPAGRVGGRGRRRSPLSPLSGWARKEGALGRLRGSPLSPLRGVGAWERVADEVVFDKRKVSAGGELALVRGDHVAHHVRADVPHGVDPVHEALPVHVPTPRVED